MLSIFNLAAPTIGSRFGGSGESTCFQELEYSERRGQPCRPGVRVVGIHMLRTMM